MLDIKLFRENPELIIDSEKKRFRDTENVEKVIEYDTLWREGERKLNSLRSEKNKLSKSFKKAKEEGNFEEVVKRSKEVAAEIKELTDTTGMIYMKYTRSMNPDFTYSETAADVGKWYALYYQFGMDQ